MQVVNKNVRLKELSYTEMKKEIKNLGLPKGSLPQFTKETLI